MMTFDWRDRSLRRVIEAGHDPVVTHDGEEALDAAGENSFDLIVLDVGLPRMDGFEVLRRLRAQRVRAASWCLPPAAKSRIG